MSEILLPGSTITYKEFQQLELSQALNIPQGTLVQNVRTNDLFTAKSELVAEKARRAAADFQGGKCLTPLEVRPGILPGRLGLVVDDGNHRAGIALANGIKRIDVVLQPEVLRPSEIAVIRPLKELVNQYQGILKMMWSGAVDCITDIKLFDQQGLCLVQFNNEPRKSFLARLLATTVDSVYFVRQVGEKEVMGVAKLAENLVGKLSLPETISKP